MLRKVETKNFKVFGEEAFELPEHLVVVGPNNCGKTSLLQAIATWSEVVNHWFETNPDFARLHDGNYPAAELNLLRFNAVPLPDFPHLWRNKAITQPVGIWLETEDWRVGFEVLYSATQLARVRPAREVTEANLEKCKEHPLRVVYVPPVSRLPMNETPTSKDGVQARLRRGRIAEVLRNVLVSISADKSKWDRLQALVREFFGYELLMLAETEPGILYVEGESDLNNLRAWAQTLGHPLFSFLDKPFWKATASERGKDFASWHFGALRKMVAGAKGVELRDGDTPVPKRGLAGLLRLRWRQTEIENYLLHPLALERFVYQEEGRDAAVRAIEYMKRHLPPALFEEPFASAEVVTTKKESGVLRDILQEAGLALEKTEFCRIAASMRPDEVHPEVREKLDAMAVHFDIGMTMT